MKAEKIAVTPGRQLIKAQIWFSSGKRETYNTRKRRMQSLSDSSDTSETLKVFSRVKSSSESNQWISFLPGFPDGSYGWSKVNEHLSDKLANPFLFVEYVGQGDSDKPENYHYSTIERADLVELNGGIKI
ncbi:MAG: alpha/beta hydrolase [Roseivirga sp.]|nr:alpha/beta hydrolase [Roseivirga sp.]